MKQVALTSLAFALSVIAGSAGATSSCFIDSSQADFQAGIASNVDLTTSSGNVLLARTGSGSIDQQNTSFTNNGEKTNYTQWTAQGFTAGVSGFLSRVDLNMFYVCAAAPPPVTVSIRATSNGLPTGSDLAVASLTIAQSGVQGWWTANFATPASVSAGTQYAIVVRASASIGDACMAWSDSAIDANHGNDVYAGGFLSYSTNSGSTWQKEAQPIPSVDGAFKTYVSSSGGSGYVSAGDLVSSLKDTTVASGTGVTWTSLSWNATVPTNTAVKFQAAASDSSTGPFNFVGPDGTAQSYFTTTNASLSQFNGNRYLKYHTFLTTGTSSSTPTLSDVTACYSVTTTTTSDVAISVSDGASTAVPGTTLTYTVTASNAGPDSVSKATVSDAFPAPLTSCHWTCAGANGGTCSSSGIGNISDGTVTLPAGGTATYTATCTLPTSATGTLANTATIADPAGAIDPNTGNNSATDTDTITPQADLSITINDGQTAQTAGSTAITYTILAQNAGPSDAPSSVVADSFPSTLTCNWTCTGTSNGTCPASGSGNINATVGLPKGARTTFTATCSLASSATGSLVDTTTVTPPAGVTDPNTANNSVTDTDSIVIRPDVAITVSDGVNNVQVGDVINYVITVTDAGPSDAAVNVTDTLPAQLGSASWVCSATGGASCANNKGNGTSMNTNATVPVGGVATYVYTATVISDDANNNFSNAATAHVTNGSDPNGGNNVSGDTDVIVIFLDNFAGTSSNMLAAVNNGATASMAVDLGVDAGLLKTLGPAPVTVATARSASGEKLFSLQLMRAGHDVLMRSLTPIDGSVFSDVAPWQVVDLGPHRIGFEWHAATGRGDDGFLRAGSATQKTLMAASNSRAMPAQLQVATVDDIPWLVIVDP